MDTEELRKRVDDVVWHHSIDLGNGIVTPGHSALGLLHRDLVPDVAGKTVLDIGAWDGYYSFLAERKGASRVVALDHYVWGVDLPARTRYWDECRAQGVLPDQSRDETDFWRDDLPGRRGFDLAHEVLDSNVEPVVGDLMKIDLDELGTFDVVLYLGVLYHIKEPLTALERLRRVTGGMAVIETEGLYVHGLEDSPLLEFYPGDELGHDYGNWFATNEKALHGLCRAAGFARVETAMGPPAGTAPPVVDRALRRTPRPVKYRIVVRAYA